MRIASTSKLHAFCAASAVAHAAAAFTLMGHSNAERTVAAAMNEPDFVEISVSEPSTKAPLDGRERAGVSATNGTPAKHTHAYPVRTDHDAVPHDPALVHAPLPTPPSAPSEPAPPSMASAVPPRFTMSFKASSAADAHAAAPSAASGTLTAPTASEPMPESQVASRAKLIGALSPRYPADARAQEIEADVVLALVVSESGAVEDAHVVEKKGFGFDEAALEAVRRARFVPAQYQGSAVAVRMRWTVSFRLE
jgi:TonB family protein